MHVRFSIAIAISAFVPSPHGVIARAASLVGYNDVHVSTSSFKGAAARAEEFKSALAVPLSADTGPLIQAVSASGSSTEGVKEVPNSDCVVTME